MPKYLIEKTLEFYLAIIPGAMKSVKVKSFVP